MVIALILIIVLYVIPLIRCYNWIHKAYSQGGIYESMELDGEEFWFTIIPIINLFFASRLWEDAPMKGQTIKKFEWINKFFKIKR